MKNLWKYFDRTTFAVLILISLTGLVLIFSASHTSDRSAFTKQILWFVISLAAFFLVIRLKTSTAFKWRVAVFVGLIIALAGLLFVGIIISGTKSWVRFGFISIQFSEFIKIPMALIIARMLTTVSIIDGRFFLKLLAVIAVPFGLIMLQPDLGTAFILTSLIVIAVLLKRIKPTVLILTLLITVMASIFAWSNVLKPYQKSRIVSFVDPERYSQSSGYQIIQSKIAIGSGGLTGKGYLKGSQSQYKFLPTRHTDFIVSVLGEEFGFIGISTLLLLFFFLFYRQFDLKTQTDEEFYFVYLFNGLILFQFLVNILMSIGFFPILGVPLPFVSYGGSSLMAFFIGEALIFKIKLNNFSDGFL
jgi:rod shape determining protein RodA